MVIDNTKQVYVPLASHINLSLILCEKTSRKVDNGGVFSYKGKQWKLLDPNIVDVVVDIINNNTYGILAVYGGNLYVTTLFNG